MNSEKRNIPVEPHHANWQRKQHEFFRPDFNNRGIAIAQNHGNSRLGIRKTKNFSSLQRKSKFVGHALKIQGGCFLKNRGFLAGTSYAQFIFLTIEVN